MRPLAAFSPESRASIRGVLFDIDDTLTTEGRLTADAYAAVEALKKAGLIVVPITGRPAGWCDHIARIWPVDGVVGENGAFYFYVDHAEKKLKQRFVKPASERELDPAIRALTRKHPSLPIDYLGRLVTRHGARAERLLEGVRAMADLGEMFGAGATLLSAREIDFCIREEWARKPDDILWRRTKCALHMDAAERARAATFIDARVAAFMKLT